MNQQFVFQKEKHVDLVNLKWLNSFFSPYNPLNNNLIDYDDDDFKQPPWVPDGVICSISDYENDEIDMLAELKLGLLVNVCISGHVNCKTFSLVDKRILDVVLVVVLVYQNHDDDDEFWYMHYHLTSLENMPDSSINRNDLRKNVKIIGAFRIGKIVDASAQPIWDKYNTTHESSPKLNINIEWWTRNNLKDQIASKNLYAKCN